MKFYKLTLLTILFSFGMQAQQLVTGKASLTRVGSGIYEIEKADGTSEKINIRPNEDQHVQGKLSVLFKDCQKLRQSVFDSKIVTEGKLVQVVEEYNRCNYSPFEPTEKEARQAEKYQGDKMNIFITVGAALNGISFFDSNDFENLFQGQAGVGIAATPGFVGSLQGNLFFTLELNGTISGDKDFSNSPFETHFKKYSQRAQLGVEYHFNKNASIKPLIGIGAGLARDHYDGSYQGYKLDQKQGSGYVIPKAGVLFSLDEKKSLGLIVSYIPEYENDLSFVANGEVVPLIINNRFINAGLYFYF